MVKNARINNKCLSPSTISHYSYDPFLFGKVATLGPAYNEHFDAKKIARCKWVLIVAELVITGVLLIVQYSYQDVILSNLMLITH